MHYFKIWMSIVRDVSKEGVMNSLQKWLSVSIIKTFEKQGKTVLYENCWYHEQEFKQK